MHPFRVLPLPFLVLGSLLFAGIPARAATTVLLPASLCPASESIFHNGYEADVIPHQPSNGSGGTFPGSVTRIFNVPGFGDRSAYLHVPPSYTPTQSWPILLALRGQSVPSGNAAAAQQVLSDWSALSDSHGFIVLAPVGNSTQGGWGASGDIEEITAALDDAFAAYNIEQSRVYLWGFSAGAHYGHAIALENTDYFAAYGVSAGSLNQYACSDNGSFQPVCTSWLPTIQPKIPVDIHLGNTDPLYTTYGAGNDPTRFQAGGWVSNRNLHYTLFAGGHTYTAAHLSQIWNNLCPFALGP
jgi:poly(3-hydroxybutyrate) depolymerase